MNRTLCFLALLALTCPVVAQRPGGPPPANVVVAQVELRNLSPTASIPGSVVSLRDAVVAAEVPGRLLDVVTVGTAVAAGDLLAQIDDAGLRLQVQEQRAILQRERARLDFLETDTKRLEELTAASLAARTQLDQTRSNRDVARAEIGVARARLAQLEDQLSRTTLKAPYDGIVSGRVSPPGSWVSVGTGVVRLVDLQRTELVARAPLDYMAYVRSGQTLPVQAAERSGSADVTSVVTVGDERSRQFEIRLSIPSGSWPVGLPVTVAVPRAENDAIPAVPRDALIYRRNETFVLRVVDGVAERVIVTPGTGEGDWVAVQGDLQAGDAVIIRGGERLRPGQSVQVQSS